MHQGIAFRTAYLVTGSAEDAEEAVTSGLLKAYRAFGRFRRGKPFRPWLLAIVMNEARNRRRSSGRHERLALRAAEERRPGTRPRPPRRRSSKASVGGRSSTPSDACPRSSASPSYAASSLISERRRRPTCSECARER